MEEKSTVQKLTLKDFEGIELEPNGFQIDYLAAISKRALDILDGEKHITKNKGKRKLSDSYQSDHECYDDLGHRDGQQYAKKKKKKEKLLMVEINKGTLEQPAGLFSKGVVCIKGFSNGEISKEHQKHNLSERKMCMEEGTEPVMERSDQEDKKNEDSVQFHKEVLRREKILKRPMSSNESSTSADDDEFQEPKKSNIKKLSNGGPAPDLPREFRETLQKLNEGKPIEGPHLVIQKKITATDISPGHNRLSLPTSQHQFLTEDEVVELKIRDGKSTRKIQVDIIEPSLQKGKVSLRRWKIGNSSNSYVLAGTWNDIVSRNSLSENQVVQVWSARVDGKLWFLLVNLGSKGL